MVKTTGTPVPVNISQTMLNCIDLAEATIIARLKSLTPVRTGFMRLHCRHISGFTGATMAKRTAGWVSTDFTSRTDKYGRPLPFYPVYVSEGTGRFRARDAIRVRLPVGRPKKGTNKYIRYEYNGGWVSLKSVKGQRPQHVVERAIAAARPAVMAVIRAAMMNVQMGKTGGY